METDRLLRARTLDYIRGARYPAARTELEAVTRRRNVPSDVLGALLLIPDRQYANPDEVLAEVLRALPKARKLIEAEVHHA